HFVAVPTENYQKGKFIGNAKGFGFVQVDALGEKEDIFIPANMTMNAIDGDEVIVKVLSAGEEGSDGKVVSIYRPLDKIVGVVEKVGKNFFLEPDNNHIPFKIKLIYGNNFWKDDRVVVS